MNDPSLAASRELVPVPPAHTIPGPEVILGTGKQRIDVEHPSYTASAAVWMRCRDAFAGAAAIKNGRQRYLPIPSGMSTNGYGGYLIRAEFPGVVRRTVAALTGMLFGREPIVRVPKALEPLLADADLADSSLLQFAGWIAREVITTGRVAVVVDWSDTAARPYLAGYSAEDITDWGTRREGGDEVLERVVFKERHMLRLDTGEYRPRTRYREYQLNDQGFATARVWEQVSDKDLKDPSRPQYAPSRPVVLTKRGEPLGELPVVILGPSSIGPEVESPMVGEVVDAALEYYNVSADYRHVLHHLGCPTPVVIGSFAGGDSSTPLVLGPSVVWNLTAGSSVTTLGAKGEDVRAFETYLDRKKDELMRLGGALLELEPGSRETATSVLIRTSGAQATLRQVAATVEQALTMALRRAAWWIGATATANDESVSFSIDRDFLVQLGVDPESMKALILGYQAGALSFESMYSQMQKRGITRPGVSAAEEKAAIDRAQDNQ